MSCGAAGEGIAKCSVILPSRPCYGLTRCGSSTAVVRNDETLFVASIGSAVTPGKLGHQPS